MKAIARRLAKLEDRLALDYDASGLEREGGTLETNRRQYPTYLPVRGGKRVRHLRPAVTVTSLVPSALGLHTLTLREA